MNNISHNYGKYCKPNLVNQLQSLSLDIPYHRGEGNYLFYNRKGKEIKVLDFLGGFGTLIFGHNNEQLLNALKKGLDERIPFASQGSNRREAGDLAYELNRMIKEKLNEDYLIILSNSGTEAIEVCIKHCFYTQYHKHKKKKEQIEASLKKMSNKWGDNLEIDASVIKVIKNNFPEESIHSGFTSIATLIKNLNDNIFERRPVLIGLKNAFHGKTMGSIQLTYNMEYKRELCHSGPKTIHVCASNTDELQAAIKNNTACFFSLSVENKCLKLIEHPFTLVAGFVAEPIQGEGGMKVIDKDFLVKAAEICRASDVPVVFDEIQTGMGRTGTFLFAEQVGITPDYIALSKGLGGGLTKIGATLIPRRIFGEDFDKIHSSTFAEDSFSAIVAKKSLELAEDKTFLINILQRSCQIKKGIIEISAVFPGIIEEIRGVGFMLGLEFKIPEFSGSNCLRLLADQDMLGYVISGYLLHEFDIRTLPCLSNKSVIRIEPSGYTTEDECNYFLKAITRLCEILYKENIYELCKFMVGRHRSETSAPIKNYRKPSFRKQTEQCEKKVAFIGHFIKASDMIDWEDSFERFTESELEQIIETIYPLISPFVSDRKIVTSVTGEKVQLDMMGFIITSTIIARHMRENNLQPLLKKINDCLQLAESNGCTMVGFGGFTSIITGNCKNISMDTISYTTGNAFTAAMGLKAILTEAPKLNIKLENATFTAVGAAGNIASVYSEFMAQYVKKIILIGAKGRVENIISLALKIFTSCIHNIQAVPENEITGIARALMMAPSVKKLKTVELAQTNYQDLYKYAINELGEDFPIVTTDEISMIKEANLILCSTNTPNAIIFPQMLGKHAIVICDIALPFDVEHSVRSMVNVKVIEGGIVRIPNADDFKIPGILLPKGTAYACMSETLLLGLEGVRNNYSYGNISLDQVKEIYQISKTHGFELGQAKLERSF